jgi:hypothetical protein
LQYLPADGSFEIIHAQTSGYFAPSMRIP